MSIVEPFPPPPLPSVWPPADDPFRYGWRFVRKMGPDGQEVSEQVPLTLEDVLHPQEGDVIPVNTVQERECRYLADVANRRLPRAAGYLVLADCIIDWGVPGLRNHSPDVSVFSDVARLPPESFGTFHLRDSGGQCRLTVEIVSPDDRDPRARDNDVVRKRQEYHQARVPVYVIIDQEREHGPRKLRGFEWTPTDYTPMPLDAQGRLHLPFLGLKLGLVDNRLVCYDDQTDAVLGDYTAVDEARVAAEARVQELEAELRRLRG